MFGDEIKYFHPDKGKSKNLDNGFEEQIWYNTLLDYENGHYEETWKVIADKVNQRITPVMYKEGDEGSEESWRCCGFKTVYTDQKFHESGGTVDWFEIPSFCP